MRFGSLLILALSIGTSTGRVDPASGRVVIDVHMHAGGMLPNNTLHPAAGERLGADFVRTLAHGR